MNKIEEKYGLKTGQAIALLIIFTANILWLIFNLITYKGNITIPILVGIFRFAIAAFYAYCGYKKPHGNLMRYLLLIYAISVAALIVFNGTTQPTFITIDYLTIIILTAYMAGRLDHYKQNIVISLLLLVCNLVITVYYIGVRSNAGTLNLASGVSCIGATSIWLLIAAGYIIRFKPHKEAGLEDK